MRDLVSLFITQTSISPSLIKKDFFCWERNAYANIWKQMQTELTRGWGTSFPGYLYT